MEIIQNGKTYISEPCNISVSCTGCAFYHDDNGCGKASEHCKGIIWIKKSEAHHNDWIINIGDKPTHLSNDALVDVKFHDGTTSFGKVKDFDWSDPTDIASYQVVTKEEPLEPLWISNPGHRPTELSNDDLVEVMFRDKDTTIDTVEYFNWNKSGYDSAIISYRLVDWDKQETKSEPNQTCGIITMKHEVKIKDTSFTFSTDELKNLCVSLATYIQTNNL